MMRQKSEIMTDGNADTLDKAGKDPQSVNMGIVVELMLDVRQIAAAQFVISNGGSIVTPPWLFKISRGE